MAALRREGGPSEPPEPPLATPLDCHIQIQPTSPYTNNVKCPNIYYKNCIQPPPPPPPPHSVSCNLCIQYMCQYFYEQGHQYKLTRVTTPSASRVFALVDGRKNTTMQCKLLKVRGPGTSIDRHAVGDHCECKYSVGASQTAQVGAACSNNFATCTWALCEPCSAQVHVSPCIQRMQSLYRKCLSNNVAVDSLPNYSARFSPKYNRVQMTHWPMRDN